MRRNIVVSLGLLLVFGVSSFVVGAQDANCGLASRFESGMVGRVLPGDANRVRAEADRNADQTGTLPGGHYFRALDGVACSGGYTWRQIEVSNGTDVLQGWTVEGTATDYFVEALPYHGYGISYEGVSFFVPESIGDGATVNFSPADLSSDETHVTFPADVRFALTGDYPDPDYDEQYDYPSITIYRTDAYDDGYERGDDYIPNPFEWIYPLVIEGIETILDERPDLNSTFDVTSNTIPDLAPGVGHGTLAYLDYADFQNGSGYRFITFYEQMMGSALNLTLLYRFEGLTELGSYLIVIEMPVDAPQLPAEFNLSSTANDADNGSARYQTYVDGVDAFFNAIPPEEWLPDLTMLDALVNSLVVSDVPELSEDPFGG